MPKVSPSQAKNYVARAFRAIADPHPSSESLNSLWEHFKSRCAYCNAEIARAPKQAHYDHLVSRGGNRLSNFVLSCPDCNERKRELDWQKFLLQRCTDEEEFRLRRIVVLEWQHVAQQYDCVADPALLERAEKCIAAVYRVFEQELNELRRLKKK
jgi:hypothetical protein